MTTTLTPKGEQTRQHILEIALKLFIEKGYEATTMRDIASTAECSLGLAYRYFARKEDLVMELYMRTAQAFAAEAECFPAAPLAVQFKQAMLTKLVLLTPYKEALGALFSASMSPQSGVAVLGESTADIRRTMRGVYRLLLERATDAPRKQQIESLATILYGAHLAIILFWLYDHTPDYRATRELIALGHDALALLRKVLPLPPVAIILRRLAQAMNTMFGGTPNASEKEIR